MNRKDFEHCACQPKLFSKGTPENQQVCDALGLHVQKSCPPKKGNAAAVDGLFLAALETIPRPHRRSANW
jgi:hypothetical protein